MNIMEVISCRELVIATNGFSTASLIGTGGFGSVYKGVLNPRDHPMEIALKVFNMGQHGASKSFLLECAAMKNIRHPESCESSDELLWV